MNSIKLNIAALLSIVLGAALQVIPTTANAYTECNLTPSKFYVGDSILWVNYQEGGVGIIAQSNPDFKPILAVFMTAITTEKMVLVRYVADAASCTSQQEVKGVWLYR